MHDSALMKLRSLRDAPARIADTAEAWSSKLSVCRVFVRRHFALILILVIALALRLQELRQPLVDAFSWRQASTAMMADNYYRASANILFPEVSWTGPGPNYQGREFQLVTYAASLLYRVFGQHEWFGRAIGAVMGTWGVFALFRLASLAWNREAALWVAFALAALPGAIFIDRSFLPDPTMLSLSITTVWLYLEYLCTRKIRYLVLTGVVGTLAWLTKLPGIITLAPMIYATLVILRERRALTFRSVTPILVTLGLMLIPIAAYYAWAVYLGTHYPPYHIAGASNWVWKDSFGWWLEKGYFLGPILEDGYTWLWTWPFMVLAVLGLMQAPPGAVLYEEEVDLRRAEAKQNPQPPHRRTLAAPWLFHWWFVGFLVILAIGARELSENPWNLHILNVFVAAMAGHGLYHISRYVGDRLPPRVAMIRAGVVAVIALVLGQGYVADMYYPQARNSYKLGLALNRVSAPGDLVVTMADDVGDPIAIYYSHRRGWVFPPQHMPETWKPFNLIPPNPSKTKWMLEDLRTRGAKWLGIVTAPKDDTPGSTNFWKDHPDVVAYINKTCEFVEKTDSHVIYRIRTAEELGRKPKP